MQWVPESSRRARGVEVWAALRSLGREGLHDLVERCCRFAAVAADRLKSAGFEVLNDVVLNQVLVSFGDPARTKRIIEGVQSDGTCWCGSTIWQGKTAMRISISSWATTDEDIDRSVSAILRIAATAS
jgi:glutamate/tyrosine decarboxylase-like PLP-dependent enzyme